MFEGQLVKLFHCSFQSNKNQTGKIKSHFFTNDVDTKRFAMFDFPLKRLTACQRKTEWYYSNL